METLVFSLLLKKSRLFSIFTGKYCSCYSLYRDLHRFFPPDIMIALFTVQRSASFFPAWYNDSLKPFLFLLSPSPRWRLGTILWTLASTTFWRWWTLLNATAKPASKTGLKRPTKSWTTSIGCRTKRTLDGQIGNSFPRSTAPLMPISKLFYFVTEVVIRRMKRRRIIGISRFDQF